MSLNVSKRSSLLFLVSSTLFILIIAASLDAFENVKQLALQTCSHLVTICMFAGPSFTDCYYAAIARRSEIMTNFQNLCLHKSHGHTVEEALDLFSRDSLAGDAICCDFARRLQSTPHAALSSENGELI
jgi:hypothetical protein